MHPARWSDFEQEARVALAGVAHAVHLAARNVGRLPDIQCPHVPGDGDGERASNNLDTLVLTGMDVTRNAAAGFEEHLDLKKLAASVATRLKERQVLTGQGSWR